MMEFILRSYSIINLRRSCAISRNRRKLNEKSNAADIFGKAPCVSGGFKNALPAMAAMLMVLIYNLADTFL